MYNLCSGSIEEGKGELPKQKNLEEILKQELAWTLEQVKLKILTLLRQTFMCNINPLSVGLQKWKVL